MHLDIYHPFLIMTCPEFTYTVFYCIHAQLTCTYVQVLWSAKQKPNMIVLTVIHAPV